MTLANSGARPARFDFREPVPDISAWKHVHFIAIGGSGVSGVALLFLEAGMTVTGSDAKTSPTLEYLASRGAGVSVGHDPDHLGNADAVVISGAVTESNPELAEARARGLPILHRAQGIAALIHGRDAVAVAGANGKTTTSAMLVSALAEAEMDTGFIIGSPLVDYGTSAFAGTGPIVIEADESDGSFLAYRPRVAIVTNVTPDHLDFYGDFAAVQVAFDEFAATLGADGLLVTNADDPGSIALAAHARNRGQRVLTWGESADADLRILEIVSAGGTTTSALRWTADVGDRSSGDTRELVLPLPGRHNVHNACAALLAATDAFNVSTAHAIAGLSAFGGTRRRFEFVASVSGIEIIDDYAHNAPKVAAVVSAGRSLVSAEGRLVVAFQPHLYSRTLAFAQEFAEGLAAADVVVMLDVFGAREAPVAGVSGQLILDALASQTDQRPGGETPRVVAYAQDRAGAAAVVADLIRPGDVLLTVGAGDITTLGSEVVAVLESRDG